MLKSDRDSCIADLARALYVADRAALEMPESNADLVAADETFSEAYDTLMAALRMEMGND